MAGPHQRQEPVLHVSTEHKCPSRRKWQWFHHLGFTQSLISRTYILHHKRVALRIAHLKPPTQCFESSAGTDICNSIIRTAAEPETPAEDETARETARLLLSLNSFHNKDLQP